MFVKNFRGFAEAQLYFADGPCTILTGKNGSGKSTLLEALTLVLSSATNIIPPETTEDEFRFNNPYWLFNSDIHNDAPFAQMLCRFDNGKDQTVTWARSDDFLNRWTSMRKSVGMLPAPVFRCWSVDRLIERRNTVFPSGQNHYENWSYASSSGFASFDLLTRWFRFEEDLENEVRLHEDPNHRRPSLQAVRRALSSFLSQVEETNFSDLRVLRAHPAEGRYDGTNGVLAINKSGSTLTLNKLSSGERRLVMMVCDLGLMLASLSGGIDPLSSAAPSGVDPLTRSGILILDEVEQHLHPSWQIRVLPALISTFPNIQIVASTSSPFVLTSVPGPVARIVHNFSVSNAPLMYGRDINSLLKQSFHMEPRPSEIEKQFQNVARLIDENRFEDAKSELLVLTDLVTEEDPEIIRLQTLISFLTHETN